jgi:hypothetical protein
MTIRQLQSQAIRFEKKIRKAIEDGLQMKNLRWTDYYMLSNKLKIKGFEFIPYLSPDLKNAMKLAWERNEDKPKTKQRIVPEWQKIKIPEVTEKYSDEEISKMESILRVGEMPNTKKSKFHL